MRRRDLLKAGIGSAAVLAAPRIGGAAATKMLVVAPTADLVVLDPVVTFNRPTRNYAYLVFDTLYGLDTSWQAQPQMVEGHELAVGFTEAGEGRGGAKPVRLCPCSSDIDLYGEIVVDLKCLR